MNEDQADRLIAVLEEVRDEISGLKNVTQAMHQTLGIRIGEFSEPLGKLITKFLNSPDIKKFFRDEVQAGSETQPDRKRKNKRRKFDL